MWSSTASPVIAAVDANPHLLERVEIGPEVAPVGEIEFARQPFSLTR